MAVASLLVRVAADIAEFRSEFREATRVADRFAGDFEGIATRAAAVGTFIGNIATDIAKSLARGLAEGFKDAIRLSSEFNNAFIGLSSVARAFGTDADLAKQAAQRLSADGLLPLKDSATGLKNLLAAGFNLDQATQLMNAFKDSAAFGRQSALSFGDAIRSATEGVKNGNSILVDNAGVTKNLSQILKEAGFSAQDLSRASSDAGVRMALFNGILKETVAQTGDAERLTQTYTGQVAKLDTTYKNLLANLGDAITQNATVAKAIGVVGDAFLRLSQHMSNNRNAFNFVSDAVILFARGLSGLVGVIDIVQRSFQAFVIILNTFLGALVDGARAIFRIVEQVESLQKILDPASFKRHAAAAEEARQAYEFLGRVAGTLATSTQTAIDQGTRWGGTLQGLKGTLDGLAKELEATRGKTVDLGVSSVAAGSALGNNLAGGADKAKSSAKDLREDIKSLKDEIAFVDERTRDLEKTFIETSKETEAWAKELQSIRDDIRNVDEALTDTDTKFWADQAKEDFRSLREDIEGVDAAVSDIPEMTRWESFSENFSEAFSRGVDRGLAALGQGAGYKAFLSEFARGIGESLEQSANEFAKTVGTLISGAFELHDVTGGGQTQRQSTVSGLASGAKIGGSIVPGWGHLIGGLIGTVYGFIRGMDNGREAIKKFAEEFGGFDELHRRLSEMGAEGERIWIRLTQTVANNDFRAAEAAITDAAAALDAFGTEAERAATRMDGIGLAIDAINAKAQAFALPFQNLLSDEDAEDVKAKLAAMGQVGQAEFERIGTFAAAAFAGLVKETGNAIGAIQQLGPTFQVLQDGVTKFGLTSTGTIDALIVMFSLVNDAVTGPILQAIQTTGQIFEGLQQGGLLTADLFQTVATDIGASFRDLEAKGGDVAKAMALSQPVLQRLWEAQQIYGDITDETTQKLLRQAEEQGLVGDHMKDVNLKILEVLIAIADVFGAQIPEGMRQTQRAATETARVVQDEFGRIKIPNLQIDVDFNVGKLPNPDFTRGVPEFASGGIVRRPTLALIGEAGPEAVVPLSRLGSVGGGQESTVIFEIDGRQIAAATVPYLPGEVRRYIPA